MRNAFGHRLTDGVLCVLDPGKEWAPAVLVGMAVCPQEASYFLDLPLCLHFGLWVITSKEGHVHSQEGEEGTPDSGDKMGTTVRYYVLWKS